MMSDPIPPVVHSDRTLTIENFAALVDRVKALEKELAELKPKVNHVFGTRR